MTVYDSPFGRAFEVVPKRVSEERPLADGPGHKEEDR
jgi:hypothetical protein